jgi:DNA-binding GntR family transcriptional regulator
MSLSMQAYTLLKHKIITLQLQPGDVIDENRLREEFGLGRTPIREALQRLDREQLVHIIPRRGTFVSDVNMADLPLLYETRAVLERHTAQLAAVRGTQAHWNDMANVLAEAPVAQTLPDRANHMIEIDRRCHEIMYAAAANHFLTDTLTQLYAQSHRLWHIYLAKVNTMQQAVLEHRQILDALKSADATRAGDLIERHIRSFQAEIQAAIVSDLQL